MRVNAIYSGFGKKSIKNRKTYVFPANLPKVTIKELYRMQSFLGRGSILALN